MRRVELVYFAGCPHVEGARAQLRAALREVGLVEAWTEWDVNAVDAPEHVRGHGSPTILVEGVDVSGTGPIGGASCRVYAGSEVRGAPAVRTIVDALRASPRA